MPAIATPKRYNFRATTLHQRRGSPINEESSRASPSIVNPEDAPLGVILENIYEPDAHRISLNVSDTGEGYPLSGAYEPASLASVSEASEDPVEDIPSPAATVTSSSSLSSIASRSSNSSDETSVASALSRTSSYDSMASVSSLSSLEESDDEDAVPPSNNPATPRQNEPYVPGTALRTPRKAFLGRTLQRPSDGSLDWTAGTGSPEMAGSAELQVPQSGPSRTPLSLRRRVLQREPTSPSSNYDAHPEPQQESDAEEEERRERRRRAERSRQELSIMRADSVVQQQALRIAHESGLFDEDQDGNDFDDMDVDESTKPSAGPSNVPAGPPPDDRAPSDAIPNPLTAKMTSDVVYELPGIYPRQAAARFYRDDSGRWQLEGALETDLLMDICVEKEEMTDSAFKMNCQEWANLHQHHQGPAMARIKAPLTAEDVEAIKLEQARIEAAERKKEQEQLELEQAAQAGPPKLTRQDTEIIVPDAQARTRSNTRAFPVGRRIIQ